MAKKKSSKEKKSRDVLTESVDYAIQNGDVEELEAILDLNDDDTNKINVNAQDKDGFSAIIIASIIENENIVV